MLSAFAGVMIISAYVLLWTDLHTPITENHFNLLQHIRDTRPNGFTHLEVQIHDLWLDSQQYHFSG